MVHIPKHKLTKFRMITKLSMKTKPTPLEVLFLLFLEQCNDLHIKNWKQCPPVCIGWNQLLNSIKSPVTLNSQSPSGWLLRSQYLKKKDGINKLYFYRIHLRLVLMVQIFIMDITTVVFADVNESTLGLTVEHHMELFKQCSLC